MKDILIVDDNPQVRRALRQILQREIGWRVCGEAENGRQGVAKAIQSEPDVILLDFAMPVMSGLEAANELRSLMPDVPTLLFTNFDNPELEVLARNMGVRAVKSKSEALALIACIQELLSTLSPGH